MRHRKRLKNHENSVARLEPWICTAARCDRSFKVFLSAPASEKLMKNEKSLLASLVHPEAPV